MKLVFFTTFALVSFAFNSILCRLALRADEIDAVSFTSIRLLSGAAALSLIAAFFSIRTGAQASRLPASQSGVETSEKTIHGTWLSALFLFTYALFFSYAYTELSTGTGALILFGSVQATMIVSALVKGERPRVLEWLGLILALGGLIYLVFPGLTAPPFLSSAMMTLAGVAWGFYTLRGKGSLSALDDTKWNFIRTIPAIIPFCIFNFPRIHLSGKGILFAVLSGAIASGIGYSVWYAALKFHTSTRAAILQLSVPVLTAVLGVVFLSEEIALRLILATVLILGGIAMAIFGRVKVSKI